MNLLQRLKKDFPAINFVKGEYHSWSPNESRITYSQPLCRYSLLHELGHALLEHYSYKLDIELLKLEAAAWERARSLAPQYGFKISQAYINQCMDTYRDWFLSRCRCPNCDLAGLQSRLNLRYRCPNCFLNWSVPSRIECLVRRKKLTT